MRFDGIYLDAGATTASTIQGNTIANITVVSKAESGYLSPWNGIHVASGAVNIVSNTIGSGTGTGSVQATGQCEPSSCIASEVSYGIYAASSVGVTIANNSIGAISLTGIGLNGGAVSHSFVGIATAGAGNATITGNTVGSLTTANSIRAVGASTFGQYVRGIESNSSGTVVITGNTVANLSNAYGGIAPGGQTAGIRTLAGANTIVGNTVRNLTSTGNTQDTTQDAALVGIAQAATTAGDQIVAQNVVHSLSSEPTTSNLVHPNGIYFNAPATATNLVSRNIVHSISIGGSNAYAIGVVTGIYAGGPGTYQNNVVRLGVDATGAAITRNYTFYGIQQAAAASFYFNSVFIGGWPVDTGLWGGYYFPSYAFYGSTAALTLENNLLVSARVNSSSASDWHYAAYFATTTGLTSDYNVFLAAGAKGMLIRDGFTDDRTLDDWQDTSGQDAHSFSPTALGQVNFVNATGDAASVDLRVQSPTVAEAAGVDIPTVTDDYAGQARAGLTPVDLGAYAGNWGSVSAPPAISYTALPITTTELTGPTLSNVVIGAAAGVDSVPGTRPRLYYKRGADADTFNDNTPASHGWKWVEASGSSGSPFDFTLDYSLLYGGGVSGGDQIQYFVIAQTLAVPPGVGIYRGILGGAAAPSSVALAADAFPLLGWADSYRILGVGGVKTVCATGCDFASLTLADGLFAKINTAGLYSDVTAEIRGDLTAETGATPLNRWTDVLGGPWTLTIQPAGGAARTVSGSATVLINLNGADRVTIDGLNSGGNSLLLRNTSTGTAINFSNDASDNTVRNCTVEGASSTSSGVANSLIQFGGGVTTGNDNNTITSNVIQWSGTASPPFSLISSTGTADTIANSGNTISNNTLKNFGKYPKSPTTGYGVNIAGTGNENWTISGNTIFQEVARTATLYGIYFNAQGTNRINGNTIRDLNSTRPVTGLYLGDAWDTTVSGNRITLTTAGSTSAWYGIYFGGGSGTTAAVTLANNQVTISPSTGASQPLYGIYDYAYSANTLNVYHNSVYVGGTATGSATWLFLRTTFKTDTVALKNNIFFNNRTGGSVNHFAAGNQSAGSGTFTSDYNLFAGTGATAASFMDWGTSSSGTPVDFAAWQSSSGGDSHSYADVAANIPAASLFTDAATGDLSIQTGSGFDAPPLPSNRGVAGTGVTDDYNGAARSTTMPDLGAFEFDVDRTGLAGPDTLAGGWGYYDTLGIDGGAITANADVNVVTLNMAGGATLDMGAHTLNVVGSGTAISNQQDVGGDSAFTFLGLTGVVISPGDTLPLGQMGVTIRYLPGGTTSCVSGGQPTVRRCFQIDPADTTGRNAAVRFHFDETRDLNGLTCSALKAYHHDGSGAWSLAGGTGGAPTCTGGVSYVEVNGVADFSAFVLADPANAPSGSPTAVTLASFTAMPQGRAIVLAWQTVSDLDLLGFHLYRAEAIDGLQIRLNGALIPGQAPGGPLGAAYEFLDESVAPGRTYRYWLEDVDVRGAATRHGPVSATLLPAGLYRIYLPLINR